MDTEERRTEIYNELDAIYASRTKQVKTVWHIFRPNNRSLLWLNWYDRELNYLNYKRLDGIRLFSLNKWRTSRKEHIEELYRDGVLNDAMHDCMLAIDKLISYLTKHHKCVAFIARLFNRTS